MNKITILEVENTYTNIVYDILKHSYVSNILEYTYLINDNSFNIYKLLKLCLKYIEEDVSEKLVAIYFLTKILKEQGFMFKYQKTDYEYVGYSFQKNSFVDKFTIEILETIDTEKCDNIKSELDILEISYIKKYNSYISGYNKTIGGDAGITGYKFTEE